MSDFLPKDYKVPVNDKYTKFRSDETMLRIMESPILGYQWWEDTTEGRKPFRVKTFEEAVKKGTEPIKHFWAMVVWNYEQNRLQVWEVTQKSIMNKLKRFATSKLAGNPKDFDIAVQKEGEGMETRYDVIQGSKEKVGSEITKAYKEAKIDVSALYEGGEPFNTLNDDKEPTLKSDDMDSIADEAVEALN